MGKGMSSLRKEKEKRQAEFQSGNELKLRPIVKNGVPVEEDAKIARIRFITDLPDMMWGYFHNVMSVSRLGKKFNKEVYCMIQEDRDCMYCASSEDKVRSTSLKMFFWVYCYQIYHVKPDTENKWKKEEYLGTEYYIEPVNDLRLFKTGPGQNDSFSLRLDNWFKRFKTLTDRDYEYCREGLGLKTEYDLIPDSEGKSELSEDIKEASKKITLLEDVINKKKPNGKPSSKKEEDGNGNGNSGNVTTESEPEEESTDDFDRFFD